jgi:hypothetical protein
LCSAGFRAAGAIAPANRQAKYLFDFLVRLPVKRTLGEAVFSGGSFYRKGWLANRLLGNGYPRPKELLGG